MDTSESLQQLAALPDWLTAAAEPERVRMALLDHVAEFSAGGQKLLEDGVEVRQRLARLDKISETFLSQYEALMPISRERVRLWEGLDYLKHALQCWPKVKPSGPGKDMLLLEHHLGRN